MCVNNLPNVALDSAAAGIEPATSSRKSNALTTYCLHFLLGASRFSVGSAVVHCVHGGSCGHCGPAWCIFTCVCRRHTDVFALLSRRPQSAAAQLELCISEVGQWMAASRLKLITDKTELIWTGSKASLLRQGRCFPALQLGHHSIAASDHVRLLGATISSDLSLDRHVAHVSSTGFYWLRQLRRVRCSLDMDSAPTLVHAFVSSRVVCRLL